jgi:hypothetical protein
MAIEYILRYRCSAKEELGGDEALMEVLRDRGRAEALAQMVAQDPKKDENTPFKLQRGPGPGAVAVSEGAAPGETMESTCAAVQDASSSESNKAPKSFPAI